ncbi:hypothetical protein K9B32_05045 [Rhizobium sp. 3T7]|uniref:hypothetical protein n=1 Tax=Rhizobium sp. 3T7 TaxID=2874922 RepID=UPI001CC9DDAA|nr:hypothetical protein [Rhizobium sp. 3T7]MBZ9789498.1 hypothetical protein [Rhizobium sp. 3T7]
MFEFSSRKKGRRAEGERVAHNKRRTPVKIPPRLIRFLRYWHAKDTATDSEGQKVTLRYVVTYAGEKIVKPHKAFRTIRAEAGFGDDVRMCYDIPARLSCPRLALKQSRRQPLSE